jgi:hypothetical protein
MLGIQSVPTARIAIASFMMLPGALPQAPPAHRSSIHDRCQIQDLAGHNGGGIQ